MMDKRQKFLKIFSIFMFGVFLSLIISQVAFSAPPGSKYSPGETLQPDCDPGDTNCSVEATVLSIGSTVGSATANSVLFVDSSGDLGEDNNFFTYDSSTHQLSLGSGGSLQMTSSGLVRANDGSASSPSFSFSGDTNTGIYNVSTDTIGFTTNGTLTAFLNSSGVFALDAGTGADISLGGSSQSLDIGGTQSISATTQTFRTSLVYQPTSNISNLFSINNSISVNNSSNNITNLIANRGAISLGTTYSGTVTDAIIFQARPITLTGGATVTASRAFVAENQTVGTSKYAFVGEQSTGSTNWNLYMSGTAQNYIAGSLGIGDSTPDELLDVERATDGTVAIFQDDDNSCTVDPDLAGVTCTSDERLKTDIIELEDSLSTVRDLRPVRYGFVANPDEERIGFIAQEIKEYYPEIVSQDNRGYLSMNYALLTPILTKGLQELDIKFENFIDLENTSSSGLRSKINTFLSSATNGIEKIFTKKIFVEVLCIKDTCIDEEQLIELLNGQNIEETPNNEEEMVEETDSDTIDETNSDESSEIQDDTQEEENSVQEDEEMPAEEDLNEEEDIPVEQEDASDPGDTTEVL